MYVKEKRGESFLCGEKTNGVRIFTEASRPTRQKAPHLNYRGRAKELGALPQGKIGLLAFGRDTASCAACKDVR